MTAAPPLELIVSRQTGGAFARAYIEGDAAAQPFFGPHFGSLEAYVTKAEEVAARFDRAARERAVECIIVPPGADAGRLERFVAEGGFMVTTGQQPGLFGGPLYNVCKGLTAVRLAEVLEERLERPVLPLFWVSSEDHDWDEASQASVVGTDNQVHTVRVAPPHGEVTPSLHRIPLTNGSSEVVKQFIAQLPTTDFSAEYVSLLESAFGPGRTIAEGFHATMQHLLGRFGLFFTDGSHAAVKAHSAPVLWAELERGADMERVLATTATAIEAAGFDLQVPILESSVNLFLDGRAGRERLYRQDGGFRLRASGEELSSEDVRARVAGDPQALSPNVLLRPVVESAVFPTLAYVGGPGEIAYFGQLRDYFAAHGISMPVVFPRWAATPVETKIRKVLDKFGLDVDGLERPFHEVAGAVARDEMPDDVGAALAELRGALESGLADLKRAATAVDKTLAGPVQQLGTQTQAAIADVEKKIIQAVKREGEIGLAQLQKAQVHLFPLGKPADRVQSPFYYLTRYGTGLLDGLYEEFRVNLT